MEEKRSSPRFECLPDQRYAVRFEENNQPEARMVNFSRNGLALEMAGALQRGEPYRFTIAGHGLRQPVSCEVCVVWVARNHGDNANNCGARIINMKPSDKIDLIEILYQDWKRSLNA